MRFHNRLRCIAASLFAIATFTVATVGQVAASQTAKSPLQSAPTPAVAMSGYRAVDGWVRAWSTPVQAPPELAAMTGGAHVQLRLDGVLVGRGQAFPSTGEPGGSALLRATREAMVAAEQKLKLPNDAMRDAALKEQASRVMVSLDLAGPLIAFEPSTWAEAELGLSPGLEGVATAVRAGEGLTGMLASAFPSLLISTNTLPHRALGGLCAQMIGEGGAAAALEQPKQIRERHGIRMYRFRTTHLAQCKPGAEPVFLYRGARLIDQFEMTAAELRRMAERMVRHLSESARLDGGFGLGNASEPTTGLQDHTTEPSAESTALALLALKRFFEFGDDRVSPSSKNMVRDTWNGSSNLLGRQADRFRGSEQTSLLLLAIAARPESELAMPMGSGDCMPHPFQEALKQQALREWPDGDMFGGIPGPARGVCALAYARWPVSRPLDEHAATKALPEVEHAIRAWIATIPQGQLVAHMPWLGWAEIELAKHNAQAGGKPADIPSAVALRDMRKQVWEHQIGVSDIDKDSMDLVGGIVFTKAASPLPTWQCTRPLAFIATMLADERLTEPQERAIELARLLQSLRFIRQLQADESIGWMAPNVEMAIGGVRAAPWDQSMPSDATSMALLTVVEALRSLDALSKPAAVAPEAALPAADAPAAKP